MKTAAKPETAGREIVLTRVFEAPPESVWRAWSEPEHFMRWWGPRDFTSPMAKIDFRVGGKRLVAMQSSAGRIIWGTGIHREIVPFSRIVYTESPADAEGNIVEWPGGGFAVETIITITFEDLGGRTMLTLRHSGMPAESGAEEAWAQALEKLAATLVAPAGATAATAPAARDIVVTRIINAPRELVWRAWTDPEHYKRWWGPRGFDCPVAKFDLRVGGKFHSAMRGPDGVMMWITGEYLEIAPPSRLVYTDGFADEAGRPVPASHYGMPEDIPITRVTVELETVKGGTRLTLTHSGLPAGGLADGTVVGWNESIDKLAESLAASS